MGPDRVVYSVPRQCLSIFLLLLSIHTGSGQTHDTLNLKGIEVINKPIITGPLSILTIGDSGIILSASAQDLTTIIQRSTAIAVRSYGTGGAASISFRGTASSHSSLRWNGIKLNSAFLGDVDPSQLTSSLASSIQISPAVDDGMPGAQITLSTPLEFNKGTQITAGATYGSFDTKSGYAGIRLSGQKLAYQLGLNHQDSKNDFPYIFTLRNGQDTTLKRRFADYQQHSLNQSLGYKISESSSISIHSFMQGGERELPAGVTSYQQEANEHLEEARSVHMFTYKVKASRSLSKVKIAYQDQDYNYTHRLSGLKASTKSRAYTILAQHKRSISTRLLSETDIEFSQQRVTSDNYDTSPEREEFMAKQKLHYLINDRLRLSSSLILLGNSEQQSMLLPGIVALLQSKGKDRRFELSFRRTARYPTFNDLYWYPGGNPSLKPEQGYNIEGTLRQVFHSDRSVVEGSFTVYHHYLKNQISWRPIDGSPIWSPVNILEVSGNGLEGLFRANRQLNHHLLQLHSTYNLSYVGESESNTFSPGRQLRYMPRNVLSVILDYHIHGFEASAGYRYTGKRFTDGSGSNELPAFSTLDLHLGYRYEIGLVELTSQVRINNISNTHYELIAWYPMPGRNISCDLIIQFKSKRHAQNDH